MSPVKYNGYNHLNFFDRKACVKIIRNNYAGNFVGMFLGDVLV